MHLKKVAIQEKILDVDIILSKKRGHMRKQKRK